MAKTKQGRGIGTPGGGRGMKLLKKGGSLFTPGGGRGMIQKKGSGFGEKLFAFAKKHQLISKGLKHFLPAPWNERIGGVVESFGYGSKKGKM
jgi:hypothetical protein